jgi:hypothetical protein
MKGRSPDDDNELSRLDDKLKSGERVNPNLETIKA